MDYSKIKYRDIPIIKFAKNKEFHIRKSVDGTIYQVITYITDSIHNSKKLLSIEYISESRYQQMFPSS